MAIPSTCPPARSATCCESIDLLPGAYLVGLISILLTKRNQRLGDLAAGTLVIRERTRARRTRDGFAAPPGETIGCRGGWDVSAVSTRGAATVRRFLERRESLDRRARVELAHRLEQGLRAKVAERQPRIGPEAFLEGSCALRPSPSVRSRRLVRPSRVWGSVARDAIKRQSIGRVSGMASMSPGSGRAATHMATHPVRELDSGGASRVVRRRDHSRGGRHHSARQSKGAGSGSVAARVARLLHRCSSAPAAARPRA